MSQSITPRVFVSAASTDLRSARKVVNDALTRIECLPVEESIFGTEYGPVREMLERKISSCQAVIHLVGRDYGGEPDPQTLPTDQLRRSWSQIEYDVAKGLRKKLYIVVCDTAFPFDPLPSAESEEKAALLNAHREAVLADRHLWHTVQNADELRQQVEHFKVPLDEVRAELTNVDTNVTATGRRLKSWLIAVVGLVLLSVGIGGYITRQHQLQQTEVRTEFTGVRAGIDVLQTKLDALIRGKALLAIDNSIVSQLVTAKQPETSELSELTNKMETLVKQLTTQIGANSPAKDDELRLRRAAATIQHNKGLILLEQGDVNDALLEFDRAIESYTVLVRQDTRKEFEDILARSLHDRGVVRLRSAETREKGASDLHDAADIYKRLIEVEGRAALKNELVQNQAALQKLDGIEDKKTPPKVDSVSTPEPKGNPKSTEPGIVTETSGISAIVVSQLHGEPELTEVQVAEAGNKTYYIQSTKKLGTPMFVEPGKYDVLGKLDEKNHVMLVQNLELKTGQRIVINPDALVSRLVVSPLTLPGFPALKDAFVIKGGTDQEGNVTRLHTSERFGSPMIIEPGKFDILCSPAEGHFFTLVRMVELKAGHTFSIDTNQHAAAIVCPDPKIEGFALKEINVVAAGWKLQTSNGFGKPMMVFAGDLYDLVLHPIDGQPVKFAKNITAKPGQLKIVGNNDK